MLSIRISSQPGVWTSRLVGSHIADHRYVMTLGVS